MVGNEEHLLRSIGLECSNDPQIHQITFGALIVVLVLVDVCVNEWFEWESIYQVINLALLEAPTYTDHLPKA